MAVSQNFDFKPEYLGYNFKIILGGSVPASEVLGGLYNTWCLGILVPTPYA